MPKYARRQIDPEDVPDDDRPPQTGHTFNVWYLQWAGGDPTSRDVQKSNYRVKIAEDSGLTRAKDESSPICLFFARGCCYKGKDCPYLHRLPKETDYFIPTQDCFGRDRTAHYKDDMGGVGALGKTNTTLFVAGFHINDQTEDTLYAQFGEFGSLDRIRVLNSKGCAFVKYKLESEAQFAKEAMHGQSLDGVDVLAVKWANEDPNPNAQQSAKRSAENAALATVKSLLREEPKKKMAKKSIPPRKAESEKKEDISGEQKIEASSETQAVPEEVEESAARPMSRLLGCSRMAALAKLKKKVSAPENNTREKKQTEKQTEKASVNEKPTVQTNNTSNPLGAYFAGYSSSEGD